MPSEVRVVDQKFFAKYDNGNTFASNLSNFSRHLKGGVLEEIKAVFNVQVSWFTKITASSSSQYFETSTQRFTLRSNVEDFAIDYSIGDIVKLSDPSYRFDGVIASITGGEMIFTVTAQSGSFTGDAWFLATSTNYLTGVTPLTALEYKFGLIENDEPVNFLSKLTTTEQIFRAKNIDHGVPLTFSDGESFGNNKAWVTGSFKCAFVGLSFDNDQINTEDTTQEFQIEHIFKINPFFRDGELDSLQGIDIPPEDIFNGNMSLKYVLQTEFRTTLNNPNTSKIAQYDTQLGSVGYLDESFNGFPSDYSIEGLAYFNVTDSLTTDKIDVDVQNRVTFLIKSALGNIDAGMALIVGHTSVTDSLSYSDSTSDYKGVWVDEILRTTEGVGVISDDIIQGYTATRIDANTLSVQFDVIFSAANKKKVTDEQDYLLYYTIADPTKTVDEGSKVTGRIDVNIYNKSNDIAGLFEVVVNEQYPIPVPFDKGVSTGFTGGKMFIEDEQMMYARFKVLNTYLGDDLDLLEDVNLESLKFKIVAYNTVTNTWFELRTLNIDLSSQVQVGNIQNIELDSTRGYILTDVDIFNSLILTTDTNDGTYQFYDLQVGYKIPWQSWLELIGADTVFYDATKENNGLNQKSSNYSNLNDYVIKFLADADVETIGVTTNYVNRTGDFQAFDYDSEDIEPDEYTCVINTFKEDGTQLENNVIQQGFTEYRAVITPKVIPTFSESVDFTEVSDDWPRYAHGNQMLGSAESKRLNGDPQLLVTGTWDNEQAGVILGIKDTFRSFSGAGIVRDKDDAALYTSTPSSILATENMTAFYGCSSILEYEYYAISGKMFSDEADNDILGYNICFYTDEFGVEHSLSLMATTGGFDLDINSAYIEGDNTTDIFKNAPSAPDNVVNWAIVVDFGKSDWKVIERFHTTQPIIGWSTAGDFDFTVNRSSALIEVITEWVLPSGTFNKTFNIDLNSLVDTELNQFNNFKNIGFGFMSQAVGGFKDVELTLPSSDFYAVLRMQEKLGGSDNGKSTINTEIENTTDSLLKQISGTDNMLKLSFDGSDFILQCLIQTDKIVEGQDYDFSALLRRKSLIL